MPAHSRYFSYKYFFRSSTLKMLPRKIDICTSKVTVRCCLFVNRAAKVKHFNDSCRTKVKVLTDNFHKLCLRKFSCSECLHIDRRWVCYTDCVGKLDFAFICKSCCHNIFCNVTRCICCRTVNLCTVLSGESTAAMTSVSAIAVYDDFTSCKTAVTGEVRRLQNDLSG